MAISEFVPPGKLALSSSNAVVRLNLPERSKFEASKLNYGVSALNDDEDDIS